MNEEEHLFQPSNSCWICKELIDNNDAKVKDHCHVTGKFRGVSHWDCNINFQLTENVPAMFHNLRGGYDSHLIFNELDKFDGKNSVILNGFEKYIALFLNKNLVLLIVCNLWILALINLLKTCEMKILST